MAEHRRMRLCSTALLSSLALVAFAAQALAGNSHDDRVLHPHSITALDGTWDIVLDDDPTYATGPRQEHWFRARVPGSFTFQGVDYDGVVWLRTEFALAQDYTGHDAALRIPFTANAYEVFVNGEPIGSRGAIGVDGALLEKSFRVGHFRIPHQVLAPHNTLALRLRTFYGNGGIIAPGVIVGPESLVANYHDRVLIHASVLMTVFFFAAFSHLILFLGRRRERHYAYFAGLSGCLGIVTGGIHTFGYWLTNNPDFNAYLVFTPLVALPYFLIHFFDDFFGVGAHTWRRATSIATVVAAATLIASTIFNPLYPLFERVVFPGTLLLIIACMVVPLFWTIHAMRLGRADAKPILLGWFIYGLTGAAELLWALDLVETRIDSFNGFAAFVLCMVAAMALRFAWLHERADVGEFDTLTNCLTRRAIQAHAQAAMRDHDAGAGAPACILLDLDHFKAINDSYGHPIGDEALRATASALHRSLRDSDLVCRWGGEEFLVLISAESAPRALDITERLAASLRSIRIHGAPTLTLTGSFGVATRRERESFDEWLRRADEALYEAKTAGRDCIRLANALGLESPEGASPVMT